MSPAVAEILKATSTLTPAEKIELADSLYNEFPPTEFMDWDPEWVAEIKRRSDEIDAGIALGRSWDEIKAELAKELPDDV
jgi:putative addiction module component (TIGR02574 family)